MRSILLLTYFLIITSFSYGQGWESETDVNNNTSEVLYSTIDAGNDYISVGTLNTNNFNSMHPFLLKTSSNGDTLWTKTFNWMVGNARHIIKTTDGNFMAIGDAAESADNQIFLMKVNSDGDTLWTKRMGGNLEEIGMKLTENSNGNIYLAASTRSYGKGSSDFYIIKMNTDGDTLWTRTFGTINGEFPVDISSTADGGCVVSGYSFVGYSSSVTQPILIKYSSSGDTLWTKTYPQLFGNDMTFFDAMCPSYDGGYILTCSTYFSGLGYRRALLKVNSTADTLWSKIYSNDFSINMSPSLIETMDHNILLTGRTYINGFYKLYVFSVNPSGDSISTDYYFSGKSTSGTEIRLMSDGGYIVSGITINAAGEFNCFLVKVEGPGIVQSVFSTPQEELIIPFPNPANDLSCLYLKNLVNKELNFSLTNALDVIVFEKIVPDASGTFIIKTDQLPQGIYFYSISSDEETISAGKLLIQR